MLEWWQMASRRTRTRRCPSGRAGGHSRRVPGADPAVWGVDAHHRWISQFPPEQQAAIRKAERAAAWGAHRRRCRGLHEHNKRVGAQLSAPVVGNLAKQAQSRGKPNSGGVPKQRARSVPGSCSTPSGKAARTRARKGFSQRAGSRRGLRTAHLFFHRGLGAEHGLARETERLVEFLSL
jgi:hypothetical protein